VIRHRFDGEQGRGPATMTRKDALMRLGLEQDMGACNWGTILCIDHFHADRRHSGRESWNGKKAEYKTENERPVQHCAMPEH